MAKKKTLSLQDQMRQTMRRWASGVVIVTSCYRRKYTGMTVSSFSSITLEPPLILICLNKTTETLKMIRQSKKFGVSILGDHQLALSQKFGGQMELGSDMNRFNQVDTFTLKTGAPIIQGSIGWFDCKLFRLAEMSTHYLVGGKIVAAGESDVGAPLLYYDRNYRKIIEPG